MIPIDTKINKAYENRHPSDCRVIIKPNKWGMGIAKIDKFLTDNSLSSGEGKWKELTFGQAKAIFIDITGNSICYGTNVIDDQISLKYANNFFSQFDAVETKYYTNLILNNYSTPFSLSKISSYNPAAILPDQLISIAVIAADPYKIGVFVRGEWD